jgi:hypothetical protein
MDLCRLTIKLGPEPLNSIRIPKEALFTPQAQMAGRMTQPMVVQPSHEPITEGELHFDQTLYPSSREPKMSALHQDR